MSTLTDTDFGLLADGRRARLFTLTDTSGMRVSLTDFGASIVSIEIPDRRGHLQHVVLGYERVADYEVGTACHGALIGRFANRIAGGRFCLDGVTYQLPCNDGDNHLHGGPCGFGKRLWQAEALSGVCGVRFRYKSTDGDAGYPGNLYVEAELCLTAGVFCARYLWRADAPTIANLTHHPYFNLADGGRSSIAGHIVQIASDHVVPVGEDGIPTGGQVPLRYTTVHDFRQPRPLTGMLGPPRHGFDITHVLTPPISDPVRFAARVHHPKTGHQLAIFTDRPGIQFYTGRHLGTGPPGRGGVIYRRNSGLCLETQIFPDSPNQNGFPSARVDPGRIYQSETRWVFSQTDPSAT